MGLSAGTHDRIHRTGRQTLDASDALPLVDDGNQRRSFNSVVRVEWKGLAMKEVGQSGNGRRAAGRALIDLCVAAGNGFGVGAATVIPTTRALRLREERIDVVSDCHEAGCQSSAK
jgi:hypothetical protein